MFTSATITTNAAVVKSNPEAFGNAIATLRTTQNVVTRFLTNAGTSLNDVGFASTGVTSIDTDIGLGGTDPFGNSLSFSAQYLQQLAGNNSQVFDPSVETIRPCDFQMAFALNIPNFHSKIFTQADGVMPQSENTDNCIFPAWAYQPTPEAAIAELESPDTNKMLGFVDGAFKIPTLRNIELTGPYMHNGGMASLDEVIEFYTRGGNFEVPGKNFAFVFSQPDLRIEPQTRADIIAFLKTLTDDRVRYKRAPFDHPEIKIPHGHIGDELSTENGNPLLPSLAKDEFMVIEAVGENGTPTALKPFDEILNNF